MQTREQLGRSDAARALVGAGLLGIGLIHLLDLRSKFDETPYLGILYVALILGCVAVAGLLAFRWSARLWAAAALLAGLPLAGYIVSRSVGLPGAKDDIGNWLEPLGLASLFVEAVTLILCLAATTRASSDAAPATRSHEGGAMDRAERRDSARV